MRIATVQCRIAPGWARQVTQQLIQQHISAKHEIIFFSRISYYPNHIINNHSYKIITALPIRLNKLFIYFSYHRVPILSSILDYRNLIVFSPILNYILSRKISNYQPDKVIISSFAMSKNIQTPKNIPSILYMHSPMQYIRSHHDEYLSKLSGRKHAIFKYITPKLRKYDQKHRSYTTCLANSEYTAKLTKKLYNIKCSVQYPKIQDIFFQQSIETQPLNYYIYTGRLVKFVKQVDKIIQLCNHTRTPLVIMGSGPDKDYLQSIAGDTILFIDWIQDTQSKIDIIKKSLGLLNITHESFGISTAEALLLGVPVFWYKYGATPELVDSKSGILVPDRSLPTLISHFQQFTNISRNKWEIQARARKIFNPSSL
jgi:glycosyltransferase involved in cell wall biosynthesis